MDDKILIGIFTLLGTAVGSIFSFIGIWVKGGYDLKIANINYKNLLEAEIKKEIRIKRHASYFSFWSNNILNIEYESIITPNSTVGQVLNSCLLLENWYLSIGFYLSEESDKAYKELLEALKKIIKDKDKQEPITILFGEAENIKILTTNLKNSMLNDIGTRQSLSSEK